MDADLHDFVADKYESLRRSAFLMGGDWAEADELTQSVLARVVADARRGDVDDPEAYAFAELMATFQHRPERREHVFVAPEPPHHETLADQAPAILVLDALHKLTPRCRAVLVLRHWDGFDVAGTADVLGLPDDRVAAYESAGLAALENLLPGMRGPDAR